MVALPNLPAPPVSEADYLAYERASLEKHELIDGQIVLMTGASREHNLIVVQLTVALGVQLRDKPREVYASDMRVKLDAANYAYPDVVVVCGQPRIEDVQHQDTLLNPTLIVEVLSPSTELYDRSVKFARYRALPSLQEYVLVSQQEPHIEHYRRAQDAEWLLADSIGLDAQLTLSFIGCTLRLADVYAKVTFAPADGSPRDAITG